MVDGGWEPGYHSIGGVISARIWKYYCLYLPICSYLVEITMGDGMLIYRWYLPPYSIFLQAIV